MPGGKTGVTIRWDMKIQLGCYECVMTMIVRLARQMSGDPDRQRELADELLGIFAERRRKFSPPELAWERGKFRLC